MPEEYVRRKKFDNGVDVIDKRNIFNSLMYIGFKLEVGRTR